MIEQFKKDVEEGLDSNPKKLSSKYFYDEIGDKLFVQIMNMPEYYLTNAEYDIFKNQSDRMIEAFEIDKNVPFELIELGAGDGRKTIELLKSLVSQGFNFEYLPVDISQHALDGLENMLSKQLPSLKVKTQQGDYFNVLYSLKNSNIQKVVLFLGSNIGNLTDELANKFIYGLGANLRVKDKLMIGVDLIKSADIVGPAYNDATGITSRFNMNLLSRINKELGADFNLEHFSHQPEYTEEEGVAKSFLVSDKDQKVTIGAIDRIFDFNNGEKIHTEISRKYNDEILKNIIAETDFKLSSKLMDKDNYFADYILTRS